MFLTIKQSVFQPFKPIETHLESSFNGGTTRFEQLMPAVNYLQKDLQRMTRRVYPIYSNLQFVKKCFETSGESRQRRIQVFAACD